MRPRTRCLGVVLLALATLLGLAACEGDVQIAGPSDGGVQTVAVHGPATTVQDSPCGGPVATGTATAATPDCSKTAEPTVVTVPATGGGAP